MDLAVAAEVAAQICGLDVVVVVPILTEAARVVDASGKKRTVCTTEQGPVRIVQNR